MCCNNELLVEEGDVTTISVRMSALTEVDLVSEPCQTPRLSPKIHIRLPYRFKWVTSHNFQGRLLYCQGRRCFRAKDCEDIAQRSHHHHIIKIYKTLTRESCTSFTLRTLIYKRKILIQTDY